MALSNILTLNYILFGTDKYYPNYSQRFQKHNIIKYIFILDKLRKGSKPEATEVEMVGNSVTDSVNMNLGKLWETVRHRGLACCSHHS